MDFLTLVDGAVNGILDRWVPAWSQLRRWQVRAVLDIISFGIPAFVYSTAERAEVTFFTRSFSPGNPGRFKQ